MFKSIEYKLILFLSLLIVSVFTATYFAISGKYVYCMLAVLLVIISISGMYKHYKKFNQNILFLLNAIENGDYSFSFSENKISRREKELNQMMNRIKEILVKAREEVINNEKFLSLIIESVSTGIIIANNNGGIIRVNQAASKLLGMPLLTHINQLAHIDKKFPKLFSEILPGSDQIIKVITDREEIQLNIRSFELLLNQKKTRVITISNIGNALEAQEMEAWVKLIRVMTHEIMNSIAPITSITDTILYTKGKEELDIDTIEALQTINSTAKGLMNFVDSYRKFSGIPQPQKTNVDLKKLIDSTISLYAQTFEDENIGIEISFENQPGYICADESQIAQILTNLFKNAIEPLNGIENARIKIQVSCPKDQLVISVANNGTPIPEEVVPHIFIPFFTTKDTGTGVGLSISRYIMRLHGGNLKHHTKDNWTIFSMVFPL